MIRTFDYGALGALSLASGAMNPRLPRGYAFRVTAKCSSANALGFFAAPPGAPGRFPVDVQLVSMVDGSDLPIIRVHDATWYRVPAGFAFLALGLTGFSGGPYLYDVDIADDPADDIQQPGPSTLTGKVFDSGVVGAGAIIGPVFIDCRPYSSLVAYLDNSSGDAPRALGVRPLDDDGVTPVGITKSLAAVAALGGDYYAIGPSAAPNNIAAALSIPLPAFIRLQVAAGGTQNARLIVWGRP